MILSKYFIFLLAFCLSLPIFAQTSASISTDPAKNKAEFEKNYAERIKKDRLFGVYIPKDLPDAFKELDKKIADKDKEKFKSLSEYDAQHRLFFSLGRWLSTNWGFYEGSRFSKFYREIGLYYPDDMSTFTIVAYHRYLNGKDLNIKEIAEKLKDYRKTDWEKAKESGKVKIIDVPSKKN